MIPTNKIPGTPPDPRSQQYQDQIEQIKTMIGQAATNMQEAERMAVMLFIPDMSYHRGAISQALKELEHQYQ